MPHPLDPSHLLLVEIGATAPDWIDAFQSESLEQRASEGHPEFIERCLRWVVAHPTISTIVVALSRDREETLDSRVHELGTKLVAAILDRPKARLLLSAPPDTSERTRHRLLGLTAALAECDVNQRACVVGAHFSANPPSSSRIPIKCA